MRQVVGHSLHCGWFRVPRGFSATDRFQCRLQSSTKSMASVVKNHNDVWPGLKTWRHSGVDERILWGDKGACVFPEGSEEYKNAFMVLRQEAHGREVPSCGSLAEYGLAVLNEPDPLMKAALTHKAWNEFHSGTIDVMLDSNTSTVALELPDSPSRPETPELVPARMIPTLKQSPMAPNAYTLHNLAHVELNAIDLAWDTIVRFSFLDLPKQFYLDFARVADDESRHLGWCLQRMLELDCRYGDMPAHNLLWEGCFASSGDVRERLAVVPMSQEARGLDAGDRLAERLVGWGDNRSAAIVARIADEEQAHVSIGVFWFKLICKALNEDSKSVFIDTLTELCPDLLRAPFNHEKRQYVGIPREFYDESMWDEKDRQKIERIRIDRREANPNGSGIIARQVAGASSNNCSLDVEDLRRRLQIFVSEELSASST